MSRLQTPIRRNDTVIVTTGKDSGKRGRVLKVLPVKNRLIVEGVNMIKRHTRPNPQRNIKGGIVEREGALHASNVQLVCPECGKMTRVGHRIAGGPQGPRSAASAREWSTNEPPEGSVPEGSRAGAQEGVRLHERDGDPQDREGRRQHGPRRGDRNAKLADVGADELGRITGQKAVVRRATKSIAQFKLRQGMPVGAMVTLRGERMYEFLDRLISVALPRVRDFRGVSPKGFDGRGNYTLGLRDQLLFPEIDYMKVDKARGMNVSVVTTAKTDEEARKLLQLMGMPFRTN